ncbi:hypothetical protein [Halovivax cerinus]|uniref:Uncharacterized protein n=1 Tax=Halovivax cerinus TaxID=1487865 RepID=A0ABD5NP59_9EURY|nr:hypothetical protein [Halovivax cerinus]
MDNEFVTRAIENDRCLKAYRLLDRFEDEIEALVGRMGNEMIAAHPHRFQEDASLGFKSDWNSGTIIANARENFKMRVVNEDDQSANIRLNVSVRWVDPLDWNQDGIDGALCAACYKINGGNLDDYKAVLEATESSDLGVRVDDDQFNNAPGIFYIPVEDATELQDAADILIEHFSRFGDLWGTDPANVDIED